MHLNALSVFWLFFLSEMKMSHRVLNSGDMWSDLSFKRFAVASVLTREDRIQGLYPCGELGDDCSNPSKR